MRATCPPSAAAVPVSGSANGCRKGSHLCRQGEDQRIAVRDGNRGHRLPPKLDLQPSVIYDELRGLQLPRLVAYVQLARVEVAIDLRHQRKRIGNEKVPSAARRPDTSGVSMDHPGHS